MEIWENIKLTLLLTGKYYGGQNLESLTWKMTQKDEKNHPELI